MRRDDPGLEAGRTGGTRLAEAPDEIERRFAEQMKGVTMAGFFTVAGREDRPPRPDRYDIESVEKVGADRWRFNSRIRYGGVDVTLPVTVTMRLAPTPVAATLTTATRPALDST